MKASRCWSPRAGNSRPQINISLWVHTIYCFPAFFNSNVIYHTRKTEFWLRRGWSLIRLERVRPQGCDPGLHSSLSSPRNKKRKNEYYFRSTDTTTYSSQWTSWNVTQAKHDDWGWCGRQSGKSCPRGSVPCCVYEFSCSFFFHRITK